MEREKLTKQIIDLITKASIELPKDIIFALKKAKNNEIEDYRAQNILVNILKNIQKAKEEQKPICQDTGVPIFYVKYSKQYSQIELKEIINKAMEILTREIPLRPNSIDSLTGENRGNMPIIHFTESNNLEIDVLFKGGGSENVSAIYSLPNVELKAQRDLEGVRKCILDAVMRAQGKGCPPYIIGAAIGGNIEQVANLSKKQLLQKLDDKNSRPKLAEFENNILADINKLKIGALGLGGNTTALGVKIISDLRHPASFFIGISFGCWALRRQSMNNEE